MKKLFIIFVLALLIVTFLESAYVGKTYFKPRNITESEKFFRIKSVDLESFFAEEIQKGNLKLSKIQEDPIALMEHHRYSQFYKGLEVFGGQIIQHYRNGEMLGVNGEYYKIDDIDTSPLITKDEAIVIFKNDQNKEGLEEVGEESKLIIYPVKDGDYHLAYKIILEKGAGYCMTGIIDAITGEMLLKYSNIQFDELTIGLGIGYHGGQYKLSTNSSNGCYYLYDGRNIRPVLQATYDYGTYDGNYYYVASDYDNYWDYDGAVVNAHAFLGLTYDYYYLVHGRNGLDDNNIDIKATVHWHDGNDNAFWNSNKKHIYFLDPGKLHLQLAAAIDIVAHEYSHGVTQFTSNLIYAFESGALNESFSDIMGTAVEQYWQLRGNGLLMADWYINEDAFPNFKTKGCRNLADPNSNSQLKNIGASPSMWYPDPCHLSQKIPILYDAYGYIIDYGGVHLNMTIYSHAYYLLAEGGTNKISGKSVDGIGIDKASKIFYRAWVYYMVPSSDFYHAACVIPQSAYDLYGMNSNELAQTLKAMEAIGWIYQ